ncbi:uncharacterized protein EV154DRAFT_479306 [Mucor mucedo]|uniref:uncharacterized protein n=1 Tax=Mucor mucedo TaxID=29922 RepID=UPI00221E410E|nr:uncharacterized protein EV154DRAFT_479306 [Mucor mucedo]KAI7893555.1 hypothetical protein EV154DRAFT_479306 [Mucor mucedo]
MKTLEKSWTLIEDKKVSKEHIRFKRIYINILEKHVLTPHMLIDSYVAKCSELSMIIKFWSYLFEQYFSQASLFLQWGDTISDECKRMSLDFKLDIRFYSTTIPKSWIFGTANLRTKGKYYHDNAKAVLTDKYHLNYLVKTLPQIPVRSIKALEIPIVMVMGIDCHVFILALIDKNDYLLEKKDIIDNTLAIYNDYSRNICDAINKIDKPKHSEKQSIVCEWVSSVVLDEEGSVYEDDDEGETDDGEFNDKEEEDEENNDQ